MGNPYLAFERCIWFDREICRQRYPKVGDLAGQFEISWRSAYRVVDFMRTMLEAPLCYDRRVGGYCYTAPFTLPYLPVSEEELLAILLARNLLSATGSGFVSQAIHSFGHKLFRQLGHLGVDEQRVMGSFSAILHGYAPSRPEVFLAVSQALLTSRLLSFSYCSPRDGNTESRIAEPHHLQHYMGSWVLLAWCRRRQDWRRFCLARMSGVEPLEENFTPRPDEHWRHLLGAAFGIFQAKEVFEVRVRFSPHMARWVREQIWHPQQCMTDEADGGLLLVLPVADLREIKMKVLQYGPDAEVLAPAELRHQIHQDAVRLQELYEHGTFENKKEKLSP